METEVVTVLKVPVKVVSYGGVTPSRLIKNPTSKPSELILVVTGNPGVTKFYTKFASRLHEKTKLPVWIVSHGGHEKMPTPSLSQHRDLYTLQGQTRQKKELINTYLQGVKLRCVGHSIGARMLLDMLKDSEHDKQIQSCYLLFPTIERMATSPNGEYITFVNKFLYWIILAACTFLNLWPSFLKTFAIRIYCFICSISSDTIPAIEDFLDTKVLRQVLFLVHDELQNVLSRDDPTIKKHVDRLRFLYGATDGWVPVEYAEDLKEKIPEAQSHIDDHGLAHSFVLSHSIQVADIVAEWVKSDQVWVDIAKG